MTKRYRGSPLAAIHEAATGLRGADVIDRRTMKAFDEMGLTRSWRPRRIKSAASGRARRRAKGLGAVV